MNNKGLKTMVQVFNKVVPKRTAIDILKLASVSCGNGMITFACTDLDSQVSVDVPTTSPSQPDSLMSWAAIRDIIKVLPATGTTSLTLSGRVLTLSCNGFDYTVLHENDYHAADFPALATDSIEQLASGSASLNDIKHAADFMAKQDVRYYLNGILLDYENNCIVATDGHRLAKTALYNPTGDIKAIVPGAAIEAIIKTKESPEFVSFADHTIFKCGDYTITSKHIDGRYPDYNRVTPTSINFLTVETKAFISNLKAITPMLSPGKFKGLCLTLSNQSDTIGLSIDGNAPIFSSVPVEFADYPEFTDNEMKIGFNSAYLLDALKHAPKFVQIGFSDNHSSIAIGDHDKHGLSVVMPTRL